MVDSAGVTATISLVQQVISLGKRATNLQYEEALLAAREALFTQREKILELSEDNSDLKKKVTNLKEVEDISKNIEFHKGAYWIKNDKGEMIGPNCTACWVDRGKLLRLDLVNMGSVYLSCPSCKATYGHSVKMKYEQ